MKKHKEDVCPGCSRHCTRNEIRCKRGRAYFAEHGADGLKVHPADEKRKKRKWEKYVDEGGLVWRMLFVSLRAKKALRRGKIDEAKLISVLDEQDRVQLDRILKKLDGKIQ